MKKTVSAFAGILLLSALVLAGCQKATKSIPYTKATFKSSVEDILKLEGENYETYDSVYYGTTYVFGKEYLGREGKIKYMTDDTGELCNVAWACSTEDGEHADALYKEIYGILQKDFGDPTESVGVNNYGAVWKRSDGNIILSAMISSEVNAVQVAFLNPKVSRDENGKLPGDNSGAGTEADAKAAENEPTADTDDYLQVTLEEIQAANSFENLLKYHDVVYYRAKQYANEDIENGYLGFDDVILKNRNGDYSYESSAASQSVPFFDVIMKNAEGVYTERTQFAGESIVETECGTDEDVKKTLARLWYFDSEEFSKEAITSTQMLDDVLVVETMRAPSGGEYASDVITREYSINTENLTVMAIDEYMPTETDYGIVLTKYEFVYDKEPEFTIEFTPEPDETVTDADYDNMSSPDDGEE